MRCEFKKVKGSWSEVLDSARTTVGKGESNKLPSSNWKRRILMAEHSPIRQLIIKAKWHDLKSWVSVHLVRHWLGIVHWVRSQRDDRNTNSNRDKSPQDTLITHEIEANAQAIINISRRRLCGNASTETRNAWRAFLETFKNEEPELYMSCVRECVYRNGLCPEMNTCGFNKTLGFINELVEYKRGFESQTRDTISRKD